jgi:hypothetical protein
MNLLPCFLLINVSLCRKRVILSTSGGQRSANGCMIGLRLCVRPLRETRIWLSLFYTIWPLQARLILPPPLPWAPVTMFLLMLPVRALVLRGLFVFPVICGISGQIHSLL